MPVDPDALLFVDKDGVRTQLQDVIYDGLERDYSDRHAPLAALMRDGTPAQRLYACTMLASWGVDEGLATLLAWARDPAAVPWAGAPITLDRMRGVDAAFELLADAIRISGELDDKRAIAARRTEATRALLAIYDRVWFGRALATALDLDAELAAAVASEIGSAVERAIAAAPGSELDLGFQAASLVLPLARVDDARAARAADTLAAQYAHRTPILREVANALGAGTGPASRAVLDRLAASGTPDVRDEAKASLARR